ncbi:MAG: GNAT family N-acetyltransferase [Nitrosopumilaceae archaeon]
MISKIEENEYGFTSVWSNMTKLDCGLFFVNPNLPNDIFFNKLTNITCLNEKMIDDALVLFKKNNTQPFVYVLNNEKLEKLLQKKNFRLYDTHHIMKKTISHPINHDPVHHIARKDSLLWTEVFCKSYDCLDWAEEVNSIVRNSISNVDYLVDSEYNSSCVALYEKNSVLGLYCLGTIPESRNKGLARSLIYYALNQVREKNLDFLILETYARDNLLQFYSNLGFKQIYEKKVYTI